MKLSIVKSFHALEGEWVYIVGRMAAMASRPLMLLIANNWAGNEVASSVAVVFLVVTLSMAMSGFDTHRSFYQSYFGHRPYRGVKQQYRVYVATVILQVIGVAPFLIAYVTYRFHDPVIGVLVAAYLASERLADESQRFMIFIGDRKQWGSRILAKAILQLFGVCWAANAPASSILIFSVLALIVGNVLAYGSRINFAYLPRHLLSWRLARRACLAQSIFWFLSMITTFIAYFDRVMVMTFQQSDMAVYTVIVSCMSIIQNAVEYFFFSLRRRQILQNELSLNSVFLNFSLYGILGVTAIIGGAACLGALYIYHGERLDHWWLLPVVFVSQAAMALTLVIREMIYWNHSIRQLVMLECSFIMCALLCVGATRLAGLDYEVTLAILAIFYLARLSLMVSVVPRNRSTKEI